ncbi:DUF2218 domain-containing protein [Actinoplanes sp. NPDC051513]|uniref:DUF2218 domain-containing protein n=1 Tax=Actinoplanes sp. NPDC051513 TaxID=3363908 RepID=UPI0037A03EE2
MLTCETTIDIDRPSRYLTQLCRHATAMGATGGGHRPRNHATGAALARGELQIRADCSDTDGTITISPLGKATLHAAGNSLTVRVNATDLEALQQIQAILAQDLQRFGRRDQLTVTWPPPQTTDTDVAGAITQGPASTSPDPGTETRTRRRTTILAAVLIAAAVAVHLGLGAALLPNSRWTNLSIDIVLAIVVGKILLLTVGRRALRHTHFRQLHGHLQARGSQHRGPATTPDDPSLPPHDPHTDGPATQTSPQ